MEQVSAAIIMARLLKMASMVLLLYCSDVHSYRRQIAAILHQHVVNPRLSIRGTTPLSHSLAHQSCAGLSALLLADTSVTEEEVLAVAQGAVEQLPSANIIVAVTAVVIVGIAVLQYSLGDLATEVSAGSRCDCIRLMYDV